MSIVKSGIIVGLLTLFSRILGYVREIIIAANLGTGMLASIFFVAFRLPNFFRRLFAEGGLAPAFIPIYSGKLATEGENSAKLFADKVFSLLTIVLLLFIAILEIAMPIVMYVLAPGFTDDPEKFALSIYLTRVTLFYLLFISLVSLLSGILNSVGKFAAAAASPILLNLTMVLGVIYLNDYTETSAHALSYSVFIAGIVQLVAIIISAKRAGVMVKFRKIHIDHDVKQLLKRMIPSIIANGITQINLLVDTMIATLVSTSAVSYLYYADRLNQLPLALIGTAMGTVLLPLLSKQIKAKEFEEANKIQNRSLEVALFLTMPCAIALIILCNPIIHVLFERGEFNIESTNNVASALAAFALGLPAFVLAKIYTTSFFATGDTKTPVKLGVICMITNIALNIILMKPLGHIGVALATSLAGWLNIALLQHHAVKAGIIKLDKALKVKTPKIVIFSIAMGIVLYCLTIWAGEYLYSDSTRLKVLALTAVMLLGGGFYIIMSLIFGSLNRTFLQSILKKISRF